MSERRVPVQGEGKKPSGSITWSEHVKAWEIYDRKWRCGQSAERLAERGGFGWLELVDLLGYEPTTWEPKQ